MAFLATLLGSRFGRIAALAGLAAVGTLLAVLAIFRRGEQAEQAKVAAASLDALRTRIATEDSIHALPPDARRERLREWATKPV